MKKMSGGMARALLCGTAFAALPAMAQPMPGNLSENLIVTGTRLGGQDAGSNATVLDAATIQARDPASVTDLLRDLPGVFVQQSGGRGSVVSLFTRGAKPNFTLVLLDGVKANDPTNTRGGS